MEIHRQVTNSFESTDSLHNKNIDPSHDWTQLWFFSLHHRLRFYPEERFENQDMPDPLREFLPLGRQYHTHKSSSNTRTDEKQRLHLLSMGKTYIDSE
jgi:hypothetical protein